MQGVFYTYNIRTLLLTNTKYMSTNTWVIAGIVAVVVLAGGIYAAMSSKDAEVASEEKVEETAMMEEVTDTGMMEKENAMMKAGSYEAYSPEKLKLAETGKVVLFFRASWCPTCRALDASIRSHITAIPEGVTILDVDYDSSTALKQKYGVTYQHTLVQVDASGNLIAKWAGTPTLADLVSQIQ